MHPETAFQTGSASNPTFDLLEPADLPSDSKRTLLATQYFIQPINAVPSGEPLLDKSGNSLGPMVSPRDWCKGAIEGTMSIKMLDGQIKLFNFAGKGASAQVNCRTVLGTPSLSLAINKSRFALARGPLGDGVRDLFLVPFRTIAVDKAQLNGLKFETPLFIPAARGTELTLPSGRNVVHDGYFFAADTGGMIKGNHIDIFTGVITASHNPFPKFLKSKPSGTFDAFLINDPIIKAALQRTHTTP